MTFGDIVHPVVILQGVPVVMALQSQSPMGRSVRCRAFLLSVHLEVKSLADGHIVHPVVVQTHSVDSQAFLLSVHLEVKSFADGHIVHPVLVVLSVPVVMALQSHTTTRCSVRGKVFLPNVRLESKSFANGHIVRPVIIILDAITLVLVPQDVTIPVVALDTLTILEVDLQNVVGGELHGTTVAVGTLRNTDVLNITIPTHLADGITLCLPNVDLLVVVLAVAILLLELNSLVICLYPPGVLLHLFLDVNLDLMFHQQFAERVRLIQRHPLIDLWRAQNMNQLSLKCHHVLWPPYRGSVEYA